MCTGVEVQQAGRVVQGQSLARRVAKVDVTGAPDVEVGHEIKLLIDLVRGAYKVRAFMPGCNTVVARPGWPSFPARLPAFPQVCK